MLIRFARVSVHLDVAAQTCGSTLQRNVCACLSKCVHVTLSLPSSKTTFSPPFKEKCIGEVVRIGSIIISHLSKLWNTKFFIPCDVIFLVRMQGKFEIDHPQE